MSEKTQVEQADHIRSLVSSLNKALEQAARDGIESTLNYWLVGTTNNVDFYKIDVKIRRAI